MQRMRSEKNYRVLYLLEHIRVGIINNINIQSINTRIYLLYCGNIIVLELKHVSDRTKSTGHELDRMRVRRSIGDAELNLKTTAPVKIWHLKFWRKRKESKTY
jgi:hypothetical protein